MKRELTYFFTALMFFTRIPIPFQLDYSDKIMNQSQKYFPLVGWIVGLFSAGIYCVAQFLFPVEIAVLLSMVASVLLTGAFHEDGFTDVCDSFGGGYGKEKILTIMKDSRIGAYGVIGVILLLLLKFTALVALGQYGIGMMLAVLVNAHSSSRFHAAVTLYTATYVSDIDRSKSKPMANRRLPYYNLAYSALWALIPYLLFSHPIFLWAFPISFLGQLYLSGYFKRIIGGYTGDCLGTVQQVCEVLFYLSILALWKFM